MALHLSLHSLGFLCATRQRFTFCVMPFQISFFRCWLTVSLPNKMQCLWEISFSNIKTSDSLKLALRTRLLWDILKFRTHTRLIAKPSARQPIVCRNQQVTWYTLAAAMLCSKQTTQVTGRDHTSVWQHPPRSSFTVRSVAAIVLYSAIAATRRVFERWIKNFWDRRSSLRYLALNWIISSTMQALQFCQLLQNVLVISNQQPLL